MVLIEFIITFSILVDSQISQTDLVSKILSALNIFEIKWSDIETNRQHNYDWRHSNSLWGKLSIFSINRKVSIELHKLPSKFYLTCSDKSFIQSSQVTNVRDTRVNSNLQVVNFNSSIDHPYQESLDSIRYSPSYSNQYEDYSSMENEPIDNGNRNHKVVNW